MNIKELKNSKFLKQSDVGRGFLATIVDVTQENVAPEGVEEDMKWCIHFKELAKPLVCNSTNGQLIAKITGSEESDGWIGKKVVLYSDPNVSFGGKLVGGIRVRAPKNQPAAAAKPPVTAAPVQREPDPAEVTEGEVHETTDDDNLPF